MSQKPQLRIGSPRSHGPLTVFPLIGQDFERRYLLLTEALQRKCLKITEVHSSGDVPVLKAEVTGNSYVLLFAAEIVNGGRQNRVVNTTILLRAGETKLIPVSCVEHGRWHYTGDSSFGATGTVAPPRVRSALDRSVSENAISGEGYTSNQGAVWDEIEGTLADVGEHSETQALGDAIRRAASSTADYVRALPYEEGATGLCIALDGKPRILQLYTGSDVCKVMWEREVLAASIEAIRIAAGRRTKSPSTATVQDVLTLYDAADKSSWVEVESIGSGKSYRSTLPDGASSRLVRKEQLFHLSITK